MKNDDEDTIQLLKTTVKNTLVEKFIEGNDRHYNKNDFLKTIEKNEKLTLEIIQMIESLMNIPLEDSDKKTGTSYSSGISNDVLALVIILCGQNHALQIWNTTEIVKNCDLILSYILKIFNCKDLPELIKYKANLAKNIFQTLSSDLTKSEWKCFPASILCYQWILKMINQPELSQYLQLILPPSLLLIDDFVTENRIIGAQCLDHIIENITIAELQLYGHGEIIYAALLPLLRIREANLIQSIIHPLMCLTTKLEFDLGKKSSTKWSKFDSILEIYLENMELEQILELRNCYISNLSFIIRVVGPNVIRWTKRLLRIFDEYLQNDGINQLEKTLQQCVEAIEAFIELSGDLGLHKKHLMFTLLMALHFTCNNVDLSKNEEIIIRCINMLTVSFSDTEKESIKCDLHKNLSHNEEFLKFYSKLNQIF